MLAPLDARKPLIVNLADGGHDAMLIGERDDLVFLPCDVQAGERLQTGDVAAARRRRGDGREDLAPRGPKQVCEPAAVGMPGGLDAASVDAVLVFH